MPLVLIVYLELVLIEKIWYNKKYENRIQSNKLSKRSDGRTEGKNRRVFSVREEERMIIAHRMRTVASADKIVVLADGTVAEQGKSAELINKNSLYSHMVKLQTESQGWVLG